MDEAPDRPGNGRSLLRGALAVTLVLFPLLTWLLGMIFGGPSIGRIVGHNPFPLWLQVSGGFVAAYAIFEFIRTFFYRPYFRVICDYFLRIFLEVKMPLLDLVLVSAGVGFAEELFFRGWLQSHIGILATSVIFTAIHGYYYRPEMPRIFWLGAVITVFSFLLGLLYEYVGFWAAVSAHSFYDFFMFLYFRRASRQRRRYLEQMASGAVPEQIRDLLRQVEAGDAFMKG